MSRLEYFLKRFLLMIPTFLGITIVCFSLCQFVPGGPVEQRLARIRMAEQGGGRGGAGESLRTEDIQAIQAYYGFDKPAPVRYWEWLVKNRLGVTAQSYKYPNRTVWELIVERLPVSLIFGITGFLLSYLICIPLGILKALRHNTPFDVVSSVLVFVGYAIPPYALGMILKTTLCGTVEGWPDLFPHGGFTSDGFESLTLWGKTFDIARHMALPVLCYMVGHFAFLTMLMKHSLLEEVAKDYVRTARAKGCSRWRTVWVHVLRNSLIPIATGLGGALTLMFAGSVLIENVFEIPGMGRLSLECLVSRDYMVFMGILSITSLLTLLGNLLSDFCYVLIDPRIDFAP